MKNVTHSSFHKNLVASGQRGMNLIEIIIVIGLIGTIMAIIVTNLTGKQEEAMKDAARLSIKTLEGNLQMYKAHNYAFPTTEQGLNALITAPADSKRWRGPYTEEEKLSDPWGNPFGYESDSRNYTITSGGPNQTIGDEDDIVYPEKKGEAPAPGAQ